MGLEDGLVFKQYTVKFSLLKKGLQIYWLTPIGLKKFVGQRLNQGWKKEPEGGKKNAEAEIGC